MTGHHDGMKCPALRESQMNVKLNLSTYLDYLQRLPLVASIKDLSSLERGIAPTFIHALGIAQSENTPRALSNETLYVCELYKHSQAKLGKWLVTSQEIQRYVERSRIFVYTSCVNMTQTAMCSSTKRPHSSGVHAALEDLVQIHTRRKNGRASWLDSRIARITGTSAAYVMTGKTVSGSAMKQSFGLSTFTPTTQMKIGTSLEPKILASYCMRHNLSSQFITIYR